MRILWIIQKPVKAVAEALGLPFSPWAGWLDGCLSRLMDEPNVDIGLVFPGDVSSLAIKDSAGCRNYIVPRKAYSQVSENFQEISQRIKEDFRPDIIHIHGTEFSMGYNYVQANGTERILVTIQGLVSVCERYYYGGIENADKIRTFRDIIRCNDLKAQKEDYKKRGEIEKALLSKVQWVGGRTAWDKVHSLTLNPQRKFVYLGETLRSSFYGPKWQYSNCIPHSIFLSNGAVPLKGVHKVIEAVALIKEKYPDITVRIAGDNIIGKSMIRISGYGKYLRRLIREKGLEQNISFIGYCDEETMLREYLRANLFICSSAIENSPNSLGEAQMLRMPYLATFCGGVPEIVDWNPNVIYRFEEIEDLAFRIDSIFALEDEVSIPYFDESRYDPDKNISDLLRAYSEIDSSKAYGK